ncbi:MAG TPA: sugar ABC transporter permease [Anaerolineales bacterium]|nr:sugar ABC transporter permease [Anaerolineales bacterium]
MSLNFASVRQAWRQYRTMYLFMSPFILLFVIFVIAPVLTAVYMSFTYYNMLEAPRWIGLSNYRLLFVEDDIFIIAIKNTLIFALLTGPLSYLLSFALAWFINRVRWRQVYTLAFYAPSITSTIAMSVVWLYFFANDRYGLINYTLINAGLINEPIAWLKEQATILPVIMIISLWMSMGTSFLVFLAGLQDVPKELYDAGAVDGIGSAWQEVWHITLPVMRPQLLFGAVMAIVNSFAVFGVAVQVAGLPSPLYAGHTIVAHLYDYGFIRFEMGYASAIAVVLFIATFVLSRWVMRMLSDA